MYRSTIIALSSPFVIVLFLFSLFVPQISLETESVDDDKRTMSAPSKSFQFSKASLENALSQKGVSLNIQNTCIFGAGNYIPGGDSICVTPTDKDLSFKEKAVHEAVHVLQLREGFADGIVMPSSLDGCDSNLTEKQKDKIKNYPFFHQEYEAVAYGLQENAECVLNAFYE